MDNRGQSIGIVRFFLSLIAGAFMAFIVYQIANPILERADATDAGQMGNQGTVWIQSGVDFIAIVFLGIAVFGLLILAIYQREVFG